MEVSIDNRSGRSLPISRVEELALFVLEAEAVPKTTELSISFVDLEEITEMNSMYCDKPEPTDVLSFVLDDPWETDEQKEVEQLLLGDIIINPDIAQKHAQVEEVNLDEEIWILVIHGILHLVGYDHVELNDAEVMEEREDEYFFQWELKLGIC